MLRVVMPTTVLVFTVLLDARANTVALLSDLMRGQPADIADFAERRVGCNYWAGESPYDDERVKEIEHAQTSLRCETLPLEEIELRHRYISDPRVLRVLDEVRALSW